MLARSRGVVHTTASSGALSPASNMSSMLCGSGGLRLRFLRHLGRVRDLPDNLDDVPVRIEDVQLPVGTVATPEDLVDAGELLLRPKVARVRAQRLERPPYERRHGDAVAVAGVEVHHGGREPVARSEPLVLARQDAVEGRDLLA